jgi:hypothetical protein
MMTLARDGRHADADMLRQAIELFRSLQSATAPLPANARAVALEEAAQICEKLLHGQKPALGAFVPPEQHCAGAIRAAATLPEAPQPATAASDALRRLSEDVMRCIDASWKPGYARDYSNLGPILAEYVGDLRNALRSETADIAWLEDELVEVMRIVSPRERTRDEDAIDHAMLVSGIRRMMEADTERYEALLTRWHKRHDGNEEKPHG